MKRFHLASDVHAVAIGDDLVFLDVGADAYFCLVDGARWLQVAGDGSVEVAEMAALGAAQLLEAGLLTPVATLTARVLPPPVERALPMPTTGLSKLDRTLRALSANRRAGRAIRRLALKDLIALAGPAPAAREAASQALLEEVGGFRRLAPWLPRGGVCLMRSLQLRLHLSTLGHRPGWVFGVRTWPFEAHCWLQQGTVVLDDEVERVRSFHPIMMV